MTHHRLLVVDDDPGLRDVVARGLREEQFEVLTAGSGAEALRAVRAAGRAPIDAVVLDIGLPDSDGRDVCQAMRAEGIDAPVLFLTARGHLADRLSGFAAGGDDYLCKPFHLTELIARVRAALRRWRRDPVTELDGYRLDPARHMVQVRGEEVALTPTEFRLLATLMAAPGTVVRRAALQAAGWPAGALVYDNTLDQYVTRLRRKLRDAGGTPSIDTIRGVGYRFS